MSTRAPAGSSSSPSSLRTLVALALLMVGLATSLGALWGWHGSGQHRATAVILVNPLEGSPFSPEGKGDDLVNLETEAELVTSDSVSGLVARNLDLAGPVGTVRAGVAVTVPTNTQLLRIRATDRSAGAAIRRAQAFAEAYLDFRRSRTESLVFDRNARINEQLQQLATDLEVASRELSAAAPRSPRGLLLQQQVNELTNRIDNLHTQLVASQGASTDPGQVVTPAAQDPRGLLSGPLRSGLAGLLAGLVLACFVLLGRARLSPVLRDPAELDGFGVPVLPLGERLAGVRARILAAVDRRPIVVQLATCSPSSGRPTTAVELGAAFGRANLETILVEMTGSARDDERAGLTDLLLDRLTPDEALEPLAPHLQQLPAGVESSRLDDLVAGVEMADVVTQLCKRVDVVLLCGGPIGDSRMQAVARLCDLTVLEIAGGTTTSADVEQAVQDVAQAGGSLAGLVFVSPTQRSIRHRLRRHG